MRRELRMAFLKTRYRVFMPTGVVDLRVDSAEPVLAHLMRTDGVHRAALLTAHNPDGRQHGLFSNRRSQRILLQRLARMGLRVLPACNQDPARRWPDEPSMLIPGMTIACARRHAARHGQAAFLWISGDAVPRLVETATPAGLQR